ncbi:MAG TPA: hypothetical protein VF642_12180 [Propionibacteriaceae bacterium]
MSVISHRRAIRAARRDDHVEAVADAWLRVPHHERVAFQERYEDLHAAVSRLSAHQHATTHRRSITVSSPLTPGTPVVKDDPAKPYKAFAAALLAFLLVAVRDYFAGADEIAWEGLLASVLSGLVTFLVTYFTKNPKVTTTTSREV